MDAAPSRRIEHLAGCGWFWVWAAVGAGAALSAVSFVGTLTFFPTVAAAGLLWWLRSSRESAFGVWTGAGALLLYVAWLQRDGPGTTCWRTANASRCDSHLSPLPWLVVGSVLFVGGIVAYTVRRR